jgi:calcium-activated chloride channel regulator 4
MIHLFQGLMDASSAALSAALSGAAYFQSLTVVVPPTWGDAKCGVAIRPPAADTPYATADIWIEKPGPVHGHLPAAQQSGGCGQPGDYIAVPHTALLAATGGAGGRNFTLAEARHFVHQWAKYRYGIFDETGFAGDAVYPAYYKKNGQILPTLAHKGNLAGTWLRNGEPCDPTESQTNSSSSRSSGNDSNPRPAEDCRFEPTTTNQEVTCSLGTGLNLPAASRYCGHNDTILLPTKQTVLCDGRSASEVILSHRDFAQQKKEGGSLRTPSRRTPENLQPEIRIVREPPTKYILAIDTSAAMAADDHWRWIHKAAHKFIRYDLPVNSNLAILTFNDDAKLEHSLVQVTSNEVRDRLADIVPVRYHLSTKEQSCVLCALRRIFEEVLRPSATAVAGAHIIIVSRPPNHNLLESRDREQILALLTANNARLSVIVVPSASPASLVTATSNNIGHVNFYDQMAAVSGGRSFQLTDSGHAMDLLYDLNAAFSRILAEDSLQPTESPELVHRAELYSSSSSGDASAGAVSHGSFVIDSSLGRDTLFGLYVKDEEDHLIKSVQFTDSRGNVYGPFTKMSSTFDLVNLKTINFVGQAPPFDDVSISILF